LRHKGYRRARLHLVPIAPASLADVSDRLHGKRHYCDRLMLTGWRRRVAMFVWIIINLNLSL
jgi:hypothetical protein